jgi:hypothetical protein
MGDRRLLEEVFNYEVRNIRKNEEIIQVIAVLLGLAF